MKSLTGMSEPKKISLAATVVLLLAVSPGQQEDRVHGQALKRLVRGLGEKARR